MGWFFLFFFQAEDGIRGKLVTGVQTCALPIFAADGAEILSFTPGQEARRGLLRPAGWRVAMRTGPVKWIVSGAGVVERSEERRVGTECRSRLGPSHNSYEVVSMEVACRTDEFT